MYPHIMQQNPFCCGAACMEMVYKYFGISISQSEIWEEIRRPSCHTVHECGPENMQKHFHSHNFASMSVLTFENINIKVFLENILRRNISAIVNYKVAANQHHFVVLEQIQENGIVVQDPSFDVSNSLIPYEQLQEPQIMLIDKSTKRKKCPHCGYRFPANDFFLELYKLSVSRCAYCQEVI